MQITFDTKDDTDDLRRLHAFLDSLLKKRADSGGWDVPAPAEQSADPAPSGGMFNMFSEDREGPKETHEEERDEERSRVEIIDF